MPATYTELYGRAQDAVGKNYTPAYEEEYRARMQKRYGEEIPAAQAMREAAQSGKMSAQHGLDLGQNMQSQANASVGSPLAARAAQYAGGAGALRPRSKPRKSGNEHLKARSLRSWTRECAKSPTASSFSKKNYGVKH